MKTLPFCTLVIGLLLFFLLKPVVALSNPYQEINLDQDCQSTPPPPSVWVKLPAGKNMIEVKKDCKTVILEVFFADGTVVSRQILLVDSAPSLPFNGESVTITEIFNPQQDSFETATEFQHRRQQLFNNHHSLLTLFNEAVQQHNPHYQAGIAILDKENYNLNGGTFPVYIEWQAWTKIFGLPDKASIRAGREQARLLWKEGQVKPVYVYIDKVEDQIKVKKQMLVGIGQEWEIGNPLPSTLHTTLQGHRGTVHSVTFSPDGNILASGSGDNTIKLWEVNTGKPLNTLREHNDSVYSIAFSPDGRLLASGSKDNTIKLWDINASEDIQTWEHRDVVNSVAFSPNGKILASGSDDNTIKLWDVNTGRLLRSLHGHENGVLTVVFSPDGNFLASGGNGHTIKLWEVSTGKVVKVLREYADNIWSLDFSPDGRLLASGSGNNFLKLWDVKKGKELYSLPGHGNLVSSVAFSMDGRLLASGSADSTIKLWDVQTGKQLEILQQHGNSVLSVAFSPDGRFLASGSKDQTIKLWGP